MSIPNERLIRLLDNILGVGGDGFDETRFHRWMVDGISLTPDLDMEDIGTLARIVSGESYDDHIGVREPGGRP